MHPVPITPMMASAVKGISRLCSKAGVSLYGSTVIREGSISYCCGWEPWLREREILSSWLCWGIKRVSCPMADPFRACTDVLNPLWTPSWPSSKTKRSGDTSYLKSALASDSLFLWFVSFVFLPSFFSTLYSCQGFMLSLSPLSILSLFFMCVFFSIFPCMLIFSYSSYSLPCTLSPSPSESLFLCPLVLIGCPQSIRYPLVLLGRHSEWLQDGNESPSLNPPLRLGIYVFLNSTPKVKSHWQRHWPKVQF